MGNGGTKMTIETKETNESRDSIKLIKNTKGYNWEIKLYSEEAGFDLIDTIEELNEKMKSKFGGQDASE